MKKWFFFFATIIVVAAGRCAAKGVIFVPFCVMGHHSHDNYIFEPLKKGTYSGYVVYGADTLRGNITCEGKKISIMQPGASHPKVLIASDKQLRGAQLNEKDKTLEVTRLSDNRLYRVLHIGTLNVYDDYLSFDRLSEKFYDADSRITYTGHSEKLSTTFTFSVKRKLVSKINEAYGLSLAPKQYGKKELLAYLATLN